MGQMVLPSLPFEDELLFICSLSAPLPRESHSLTTSRTTEAHQEATRGHIKGAQALHTPWYLSATPPLNHHYKTPHQITPTRLGHTVFWGTSPLCRPLLGKAIKLSVSIFTHNSRFESAPGDIASASMGDALKTE